MGTTRHAARRDANLVLGIMSGTSMDGVDYALCDFRAARPKLLDLWSARFPTKLADTLHTAARGDLGSHDFAQLHHDLGRFYAAGAVRGLKGRRVGLAGLHGQTVFHNPRGRRPATFQIGEAAWLAEAIGARVVSNFRAADLAAGGEGAPLATLFHQAVFARKGRLVCVQNLGGIGNVTALDWTKGDEPAVLAFDTGPANIAMNLAMRRLTKGGMTFDRDGRCAAKGTASEVLLARLMRHPFLRRRPPKSTGREEFGEVFVEEVLDEATRLGLETADTIATLAAFTARSIALNYRLFLGNKTREDRVEVILAGGGAANPTLRTLIARELAAVFKDARVETTEDRGWPLQSVEAAAFALLAWRTSRGQAGNLPGTTGARGRRVLGQVGDGSPPPRG